MATLEDVALLSGVSSMTVSRVINGKNTVSDDTKEKVWKAINELGYRPNLIARSLATSKTNTIGVLLTRLENPLYSVFVSGICSYAAEVGYDVIVSTASNVDTSLKSINTLLNKQIDGLIVLPVEFRSNDLSPEDSYKQLLKNLNEFFDKFQVIASECKEKGFPIVVWGSEGIKGTSGEVLEDYQIGAEMAVEYLISKNHKKIGFIANIIKDKGIWGERYRGFFKAMKQHGYEVNPEYLTESMDTLEGGYYAMTELLNRKNLPTAIYCANDVIAAGAVNAAIDKGLRIPQDISIIGHDGSLYSEISASGLTTVSIRPQEMGRVCMKLLLDKLNGKETEERIVMKPVIIERNSVKQL